MALILVFDNNMFSQQLLINLLLNSYITNILIILENLVPIWRG